LIDGFTDLLFELIMFQQSKKYCFRIVTDVQHADVKYADACLRCVRTLVCRRSTSCVDIIFSVRIFEPLLFVKASGAVLKQDNFTFFVPFV